MEETKMWWQSKSIWGSLIVMLMSLARLAGHPINLSDVDTATLATTIVTGIQQLQGLITLIAGFVAWYGRYNATEVIAKRVIAPPK